MVALCKCLRWLGRSLSVAYIIYYLYFEVIRVNTQGHRARCKGEGWTEGTVGRREDGGLGGNGTMKEVIQIRRFRFVDGLER